MEPFFRSVAAASQRAEPNSIDSLGTALTRQVVILQAAARLLRVNYASYCANEPDGWARLVLFTEALYQQIHAAVTTAAVLVARTADPPLKDVGSLSNLRTKLENNRSHPLEVELRRQRRTIALLTWLLEARNCAIQHRAERGYLNGQQMVLLDGFVLITRSQLIDPSVLRKARDLFRGLNGKYGEWNQVPNNDREALTYLDLASHELWDLAPSDFDSCRRVLAEAGSFDLVVSLPVLENADAALSALIELAPLPDGHFDSRA